MGIVREMDHEKSGQNDDRQHDVNRGASKGDDQPLPARLGQKGSGIGTASSPGCSPAIFTYPPNRIAEKRKSVSPRLNPNSRGPKPKLKVSILTSKKRAAQIVAQLMEQDHHPDQNQKPPDVLIRNHCSIPTYYTLRANRRFGCKLAPPARLDDLPGHSRATHDRSPTIPPTDVGSRTGTRSKVSATVAAIAGKGMRPARKASTAISSAAFSVAVADPPAFMRFIGQLAAAETS